MFVTDFEKRIERIEEKINAIQCVKSVQRGTCSLGTSNSNITININKVDINKTVILLQGASYHSENISSNYIYSSTGLYISNISETSFVITQQLTSSSSKSISWQVIEFY